MALLCRQSSHLRLLLISCRTPSGLAVRQRHSLTVSPLPTHIAISIDSAFGHLPLAFQSLDLRMAFLNFHSAGGKNGGLILGSPRDHYFLLGAVLLCNNAHVAGNRMSLCDPAARCRPEGELLGEPSRQRVQVLDERANISIQSSDLRVSPKSRG